MSNVLTINGGSSSIRFAIFATQQPPRRLVQGKVDRIGTASATLSVEGGTGEVSAQLKVGSKERSAAINFLFDWLEAQSLFKTVQGVGHRVVHGMQHTDPEHVTSTLLNELKNIVPFDPEHLPLEIALIEELQRRYPKIQQVVCFDTAFHRHMPRVATQLPIPRRYAVKAVQRYGFHGLSYTFLMEELTRLGDPASKQGRVILAHLGGGASLAAVRDGRGVDTSMGFTPSAGLVMGTRSGDLDPGLMSYLAVTEAMTAGQFQTMVNHESGLLGISETSADIRDLLEHETTDSRAADALALFCYQAKKWLGSFVAVLGGVDTVVFAGGIGENSYQIRERICDGLSFLGIDLDNEANRRHAPIISIGSTVVRVLHTDEESVIASMSMELLKLTPHVRD